MAGMQMQMLQTMEQERPDDLEHIPMPVDLDAKPEFLSTIALWVAEGDSGGVMCFDCHNSAGCYGCPVAHRQINGVTEYYRTPKHKYPGA